MDIPAAGGLSSRCSGYLYSGNEKVDIVIDQKDYRYERYSGSICEETIAYVESGRIAYSELLYYQGMYLHASAVAMDERAYLFSAYSGIGKSTHTQNWQRVFADKAMVFNDDKPVLRRLDDRWYAYGTPWCGKDHININMKVPLAGICFLKQAEENRIRRISPREALPKLLTQTISRNLQPEKLDLLLQSLNHLLREIPIFELENRPEPEAALLSYETMRCAAEEAGL